MESQKKLRVGIIGAGSVAQVIHLPTLHLLQHLYTIHAICDVSANLVKRAEELYNIPKAGTDPYSTVISDPEIDVVFNMTSDEYHEIYTIAALRAGKNVMQEKPMTLSVASAERILAAEKEAAATATKHGKHAPRVFVGYQRRYAHSFVKAFLSEVAGIDRIMYARSRGLIGPNSYFIDQSGTFSAIADDLPAPDSAASKQRNELIDGLLAEAFPGKEITKERYDFCRFMGYLGSHEISLMRETLGMPTSVVGVSTNEPFYSAILNFEPRPSEDGGRKHRFSCTYETGIDQVPRFDSSTTVYGMNKTVSIQYDTPFVKGLPIKVRVDEKSESGEVVTREIMSSYEDAYTAELQEMYLCFTEEGKEIKTSVEDALQDLRIYQMMYEQYERQLEQQNNSP